MQAIMCDNCLKVAGSADEFDRWFVVDQQIVSNEPVMAHPLAAIMGGPPPAPTPQILSGSHAELCSTECVVRWVENGCRSEMRDERFPEKQAEIVRHQTPPQMQMIEVPGGAYL